LIELSWTLLLIVFCFVASSPLRIVEDVELLRICKSPNDPLKSHIGLRERPVQNRKKQNKLAKFFGEPAPTVSTSPYSRSGANTSSSSSQSSSTGSLSNYVNDSAPPVPPIPSSILQKQQLMSNQQIHAMPANSSPAIVTNNLPSSTGGGGVAEIDGVPPTKGRSRKLVKKKSHASK
jgi:hypothetical protein